MNHNFLKLYQKKLSSNMLKFVRKSLSGKSLTEKNGLSELLTNGKEVCISNSINGKEIYSQIWYTEKNFPLKYHNGRKIGSQISLTEKNCDFKNI